MKKKAGRASKSGLVVRRVAKKKPAKKVAKKMAKKKVAKKMVTNKKYFGGFGSA